MGQLVPTLPARDADDGRDGDGERRTTVEGYLNNEKLTLSNMLLDTRMDVPRHYATPGLPITLFIGADGKLRSVHVGEISREALTGAIDRLIAK